MENILNENQQLAVNTIEGQLLLIACPGSGKTTVIVERAHNMIQKGISPSNILVITFTNNAANQMKDRYEKKYGADPILFGTIHSLCFRVLSKKYGYTREDILKNSEQWEFFRNEILQKKIKCEDMENFIKGILEEISYVRNREMNLCKFKSQVCEKPEVFAMLYNGYMEYKDQMGKIDFDDMLISCRNVLQDLPQELEFWQKQFPYIMVDEYQDTNRIQAEIFYLLAGDNGNICVVGDDDQSIYKFRAADYKIMLDFPNYYSNCKKIPLTVNYRSKKTIIDHASMLIENNKKRFKKEFLAARKDTDGIVKSICVENISKEADTIMHMIEQYHANGISYSEMAVLYRTNVQNQLLLGKLMKNKIPFFTTEAPRDYHNDFIFGDIMAYYRLTNGTWKKGDAQRVLNRPSRYIKAAPFKNISFSRKNFLDKCNTFQGDEKIRAISHIREFFSDINDLSTCNKPYMFCRHMDVCMGYRNWLKGFAQYCMRDEDSTISLFDTLIEESKEFDTMDDWKCYADFYASELEKKRKDRRKDGVCLSTFHSAKGLEWKVVFIIDADEGICPMKQASTEEDYEEERRAFYVAVTRAKDDLYIFYNKNNGEKKKTYSRYLDEMRCL